jgi:hypothetical protein
MEHKHLNFGVYEATDNFRAIQQHSCVCFDDMGLVAVTGPAEDKEAQEYAELFAAAPDLLAALKAAVETLKEEYKELGPCDHSVGICFCDMELTIRQGEAAITKATGVS